MSMRTCSLQRELAVSSFSHQYARPTRLSAFKAGTRSRLALGRRLPGQAEAPLRLTSVICRAEGQARGGGNNLNVDGKPPTSPAAWEAMQEVLKQSGVKNLAPQEVVPAQERGMAIIDVRPQGDYDEYHIPGSVNVPFYRLIDGWSAKQVLRRTAYAFFGVFNGTEYNPNFVQEAGKLVDPEAGALLVCNLGGVRDEESTKHLSGTSRSQTRSLMAAYELANAGFGNLATLKGGFAGWIDSGREVSSNVYDMAAEEEAT